MRKAKTTKDAAENYYGGARDLLSTPLLLERSDDEGDDEATDDPIESPFNGRGSREGASIEEGARGGGPSATPKLDAARQRTRDALAPRGGRTDAAAAAAAAAVAAAAAAAVAAAAAKPSAWGGPEASEVETVMRQPERDYRSEGEQPSTERNGSRRPLKQTRQGSFRAARMPKRGGRKRLRRLRPVRRKIRVSSYCVSRELQTLQLLRWLETQTNRRLSHSIRAHGGAGPRGPVSAATRTAAAAAATGAVAMSAMPGASARPVPRGGGRGGFVGRSAGTLTATAAAAAASGGEGAPTVEQLEWMDSLYIDVLHSTTDLRGGIRKARDLERPAWEDVVDGEEEVGGGGVGGSYDAGAAKDRRAGRREGSGGREREEEEDDDDDNDDVVTHKDVIFFPYGAVVFWGCSEAEEKEMLSSLNRFMVGKVSETELAQSFDDMTFVYRHRNGKKNVPLKNDEITLDTRDPAEKLAYSCALAQSAKLFVFEERLDNIIESTAKYPQILAATGKIPLTEIEIGRLVGRVLCEQNEVNLHSDILDTPEYFWEEDAWEPAYEALCAYLDIPLRLDNVNKRLSILRELLDVLSTQSTNSHATRLEVIIIYLILIEVAIELVWNVIIKDVFHLVGEECH